MSRASDLRKRAARFLRLKGQTTDAAAQRAATELAAELEMTAEEIERRDAIRERAHAIWVAHGRPAGRDVEFWLSAERDVDLDRGG